MKTKTDFRRSNPPGNVAQTNRAITDDLNARSGNRTVIATMTDQVLKAEEPLEIEKLGPGATILEIFSGVGIALGLSLLWVLEAIRNRFFRTLDRMNVRSRPRRASAFPPGRPRKRVPVAAQR